MNTLALSYPAWDLTIDGAGNIGLATGATAQAQDAASAIKTFQGECYYNTTLGVPYWTRILGQLPSLSYLKAQFVAAALTVPGTVKAAAFITAFSARKIQGQVQIVNEAGIKAAANF